MNRKNELKIIFGKKIEWEEYSSLVNRYNALVNTKENYIIAMYTITVAIIGFAFEGNNPWLYLLPYIILIAFQRIIDSKMFNCVKISAFLACFSKDTWETQYECIEEELFAPSYECSHIERLKIIRISSVHLGLVCTVLCVISLLTTNFTEFFAVERWGQIDWIISGVAVTLLVFQSYWSRNALSAYKTRKKYIDSINKMKMLIKEE